MLTRALSAYPVLNARKERYIPNIRINKQRENTNDILTDDVLYYYMLKGIPLKGLTHG